MVAVAVARGSIAGYSARVVGGDAIVVVDGDADADAAIVVVDNQRRAKDADWPKTSADSHRMDVVDNDDADDADTARSTASHIHGYDEARRLRYPWK